MAVATTLAISAGVAGATQLVKGGIAKRAAKKEQEKQEQIAKDKQKALEEFEANRQEVINPYENMANEFENLGVATQAAKFQAEEQDIALANTLDTIAQTGGGSGGATALARMALESKRGISASIEQQEAANQKARAEGAQKVNQLKAAGEAFKFEAQESRDISKQEMLRSDQLRAENSANMARLAKLKATTDMVGAVGGTAEALAGNMTGGGTIGPPKLFGI
tara:strand:- start:7471 stop:8139 length:669 start_codon:yes stop_codon:yes gene_type:complete